MHDTAVQCVHACMLHVRAYHTDLKISSDTLNTSPLVYVEEGTQEEGKGAERYCTQVHSLVIICG